MAQPIIFTVPAGLHRTQDILALNERVKALGKNIHIHAYDTIQDLSWNGGRLTFNKRFVYGENSMWRRSLTQDELQEALTRVKTLNDVGIPFNLVLNNTLENVDIDDEVGNYLLDRIHNEINGVTVASRALTEHISSNFPKYNITASICFCIESKERAKAFCDRYDKVVLLPKFAYTPELLEGLPIEKLVFIVNDHCSLICGRKEHYDAISRCYLGGNTTPQEQYQNMPCAGCFLKKPDFRKRFLKLMDVPFNRRLLELQRTQRIDAGLSPSDMDYDFNITPITRRDLIHRGVCNFKFQGRDSKDSEYQTIVIDFIEKMAKEEL